MARKDSSDCVVTVTIELGHQANFLKEPSPEGFTHDWTVFVRGYEGSQLKYFVEKVVFKLHKTFKSPVRVISEPPFEVTESGYAGFILPIEIHFKNKQTPRKIVFSYDLFLNAKDSPPINNVRYEKLKFQNPTPEFKAKLIKAGGTEQGAEHVPYELFGSPVKSEKKALPKIPRDKEKDKEKSKKKKQSSPHAKSASPTQSLSSLSSMSPDDDDDDGGGGYTAPLPPPPPVKKEKEPSVKKGSSSSSQPKQESISSISSSSSSSHKDKSKHRSSSSHSSHKERSSSEKDGAHKPHKHKEKDKDRDKSTSHKIKEGDKKERDSNSQKIAKENLETRKEREGSHSSGKSSVSSSQHDNKNGVQVILKDKDKSSQSKDKDTLSSSKEKSNSSSKDREKISSKEKHSAHKDVSPTLNTDNKKIKEDTSKVSKEKDRHSKKSHKRHLESAVQEDDSERKKIKSSSNTDERSVKPKNSSEKEKGASKESKEKEPIKEVQDKASKSSSSSGKSKHEKSRHSEKHKHSHGSGSKQESSTKQQESPQNLEKSVKSETMTQSERLAMTADFQPQLLLSPLKSKSDEEDSPTPSPLLVEKIKPKPSTGDSSPDSQSSIISSDDANKSDHEMLDTQVDDNKHIVSGLTDSDSDSEEEVPYLRSPQKDLKSILNKQAPEVTQAGKNSSQKHVRQSPLEEKSKNMERESTENSAKKVVMNNKYSKEEMRTNNAEENKSSKVKYVESKMDYSDDEVNVEDISATNITSDQGCNGLDILAPNGISIGELIAINEKIEKAQADSNQELLDKVIQVVGETDDFDISDVSLSFDICSIDKNVVLQIQAVLREY